MDIHKMAKDLNNDFTWSKDPIWEHFRFNTGDTVVDDCDGYALAALYRLKGSITKAILSLAIGESRLIWCNTKEGEAHYALKHKGLYLDNIYNYWRKDLIHEKISYVPTPIILWWLIVGKVYDTLNQ